MNYTKNSHKGTENTSHKRSQTIFFLPFPLLLFQTETKLNPQNTALHGSKPQRPPPGASDTRENEQRGLTLGSALEDLAPRSSSTIPFAPAGRGKAHLLREGSGLRSCLSPGMLQQTRCKQGTAVFCLESISWLLKTGKAGSSGEAEGTWHSQAASSPLSKLLSTRSQADSGPQAGQAACHPAGSSQKKKKKARFYPGESSGLKIKSSRQASDFKGARILAKIITCHTLKNRICSCQEVSA